MEDRYDDKGLVHDQERLNELQALSLDQKIGKTISRLTEFIQHFGEDGVYVSVSGGKDSAVLWDITHKLFPNVPAVFSDTGLEYPEVRDFAKNIATEVVSPKLSFVEVIRQYGYAIISKEVSEAIYYARRNRVVGGLVSKQSGNDLNSSVYDLTGNEKIIGVTPPHLAISKETAWKRLELTGNRPPVTRKEYYKMEGIFSSTNVAPPPIR